jgi:DNA (cytosine-5)-methyltransferase 1
MRSWVRYDAFLAGLAALGYQIRVQTLNAALFGVAQSRKRLFILCDKEARPPSIQPRDAPLISARDIINWNGSYQYSPLHKDGRAEDTLERAARAIRDVGSTEPFLLVYYGTDKAGGWQKVDVPLRTVTTLDRFAVVRPNGGDHEMRMLQPDELKLAMGMPKAFRLRHGNRRERVKLLGNAVCPPVMEAVVRGLSHPRSKVRST